MGNTGFLNNINKLPLYWNYADDIFILTADNIDLKSVVEQFNHARGVTDFFWEVDENSFRFLNEVNGRLRRAVYRKPTCEGQYIHFASFVSKFWSGLLPLAPETFARPRVGTISQTEHDHIPWPRPEVTNPPHPPGICTSLLLCILFPNQILCYPFHSPSLSIFCQLTNLVIYILTLSFTLLASHYPNVVVSWKETLACAILAELLARHAKAPRKFEFALVSFWWA